MRIPLAIAAMLTAFASATLANPQPAWALQRPAARQVDASDTGQQAEVRGETRRSEPWYCTAPGCAGARASSGSALFGFAATTLAAAWISRRRPASRF